MIACSMNALPKAKPAICSTSQPLQTGFSAGGSAAGTGGRNIGEDASGARGTEVWASLFSNGCSNCGSSGDDKNILSPVNVGPQVTTGFESRYGVDHVAFPCTSLSWSAGAPSAPTWTRTLVFSASSLSTSLTSLSADRTSSARSFDLSSVTENPLSPDGMTYMHTASDELESKHSSRLPSSSM